MRRILLAAVLLSFIPTANAAEKGKVDWTTNGEYRVRYLWEQAPSGNKDDLGSRGTAGHRLKLGANWRLSEKFGFGATALHNAAWGSNNLGINATATDTNGDTTPASTGSGDSGAGLFDGTGDGENMVLIHEAFGTWMMSEDMTLKVGRQAFGFGDESVMGVNDWEAVPYSFEGVLGNYEMDFGTIKGWVFQLAQFEDGGGITAPATSGSEVQTGAASGDAEYNMYGLDFDLKTMPEWLKMVNVHVMKLTRPSTPGSAGDPAAPGIDGQDLMRYGASLGFGFGLVDLKAVYNVQTGDYKEQAGVGGAVTDNDGASNMMQAEVGFNFENFMKSRLWVLYHQDTGDSDGTDDKNEMYNPLFNEQHSTAGLMDLFNWGNLTYISVGWDAQPSDSLTFGVQAHMFQRTESHGGLNAGVNGEELVTGIDTADAGEAPDDALGQELDVYAEHKYDGGLSLMARLGYFMPGDAFDSPDSGDRGDAITQVFLQGKMSF